MLYVMGGDTGPLKIGRAKNPTKRLRVLATGCDRPIRILAKHGVEDGLAADAEAIAHRALLSFKAYGEWFDVSLKDAEDAILSAIAAVRHGEKAKRKSVGRRMEYPDKCVAPFPANTFARIAKVLADDEDRTSFMREAVEKLLAERENKPRTRLRG